MHLTKTQRIIGLSLIGAAIILFFVFRPTPLPVDVAVATLGPLQETLEGEGVTRVNDRFVIAAPVSGKLVRVRFEEGATLRKGEVVAELLPPQLDGREEQEAVARAASSRAALDAAIARQRRTTLTLAQAERRSARYRNLFSEGAISKETFELSENEAKTMQREGDAARSEVDAARYSFEALQAIIDRQLSSKPVQLFSPVEGRVLRIHEKSERMVAAGAPLLDIGDPASIEIVIDVLSSDAIRIHAANKVKILDWGGKGELLGVVQRIEPAAFTKLSALGIEEKRVNIIVVLQNREPLLGDNFRVQASIVLREANRVLRVPVSALFRGKKEWHLFAIEGGRAIEKAVTIGMRGTYDAEVVAGLRPGERVVVHPSNELRDGMAVKVAD